MPDVPDDAKARRGLPRKVFAKADDQIRERTDRFHQVYANNFRMNVNSWDIALTFGEIMGEKDGQSIIEETTKVIMTREMVKVLAIILQNHIDAFEAEFGAIKIPISPDEIIPDTTRTQSEPEAKK